jgi:hypothetical protein
MTSPRPAVGAWYQNQEGDILKVVALDDEEFTVEIQYYDGSIEEYDLDTWEELELLPAEAPEDWAGSLDLSSEDYGVDLDYPAGENHSNPLDDLDLD